MARAQLDGMNGGMSAIGTKQTSVCVATMSAAEVKRAPARWVCSGGVSVSNFFRLDSPGLPGLAVVVSGDLEHPGAGLRIAK